MNKLIYLLVTILLFSLSTVGQVAKLTLKSGSGYNFIFNSFQKYKDGIILTDHTRLEVFWDEATTGLGWHIECKENDNDGDAANIIGTKITNSISLNDICISASNIGANNAVTYNTLSPSNVFQEIIGGGNAGVTPGYTDEVQFTYYFGADTAPGPGCACSNFQGKKPDFYSFEIIYELSAE